MPDTELIVRYQTKPLFKVLVFPMFEKSVLNVWCVEVFPEATFGQLRDWMVLVCKNPYGFAINNAAESLMLHIREAVTSRQLHDSGQICGTQAISSEPDWVEFLRGIISKNPKGIYENT